MTTNRENIEQGRRAFENGRKTYVGELREGNEISGVGVLEADPEPLGDGRFRLYVGGEHHDVRADARLTVCV